MAKMKKKQQNEKLYCPYCGGLAVLRPAEYVYGERNLNPDNYLYVCSGYPSCDSYIGVHKKSMRPMGTLANGDLRHKRIEAHRALNKVVQAGIMTNMVLISGCRTACACGKRTCTLECSPSTGVRKLSGSVIYLWNNMQRRTEFLPVRRKRWQHEKWKKYPAFAGG